MKKSEEEFEYEYNPVKEMKGQEKAKAVIWSTKSVNMALDAIKKGLPLKANPFIGSNTRLLKPELVYKRTEEEVEDYMHCMEDVLYFASKCFLMTAEGLQTVKLRDYQVEYLKSLEGSRFNILLAARQSGKCIAFTEEVIVKCDKTGVISDKFLYADNTYKIPMYELYNIFCKKTLLWTIKYNIYKLIRKISDM